MPNARRSWLSLSLVVLLGCADDPSQASTTTAESSTTESSTTDTGTSETTGDGAGICMHQCMLDADCFVSGIDAGLQCVDGDCQLPPCTTDEACVADLSGWTFGFPLCTPGGGECEPYQRICLDVFGEGHCVMGPTDLLSCADTFSFEVETIDIDGNPVVVCGKPDAICHDDGYCTSPCSSDDECLLDFSPICDVQTGRCVCGTDADCENAGTPAAAACMPEGFCGCTDDQQCIDAERGDVCNPDGRCGCTSDMACANIPFSQDGGMMICAEP